MVAISVVLTAIVIPTGGRIIALFGAGEQAVAIGNNFFLRIAYFYIIYGLATAVRSYLEGIGDILFSGIVSVISLISRIIASYVFVHAFSNMVIAYAEIFSWFVLLILYALRLATKKRNIVS